MGLRDTLNRNPIIIVGATAVLIALAAYRTFSSMRPARVRVSTQAYFTVDDGKSLFVDNRNPVPPFPHDGKEAVRAAVFTCDGGKTQFTAYLERFTPEYKAKREAGLKGSTQAQDKPSAGPGSRSGPAAGPPPGGPPALGTLLKKPGGTDWVRMVSPEGIKIQQGAACPGGGDQGSERVNP